MTPRLERFAWDRLNRLERFGRFAGFSSDKFNRLRPNSETFSRLRLKKLLLFSPSFNALVDAPKIRTFDRFHMAFMGEAGSFPSSIAQSAKGSGSRPSVRRRLNHRRFFFP